MLKKLLIVDDEADMLDLLNCYFTRNGYYVMTASNGQQALAKAGQSPDLILLDINMPDLDGLEVCRRIRDYLFCPILFLTARVSDKDKIAGLKMGGDDYIIKPFSIEELGARVSAHLRREERRNLTQKQLSFDDEFVIDYSAREIFLSELSCRWANKQIYAANAAYLIDISDAFVKEVSDNIVLYENPTPIFAENMAAVRKYQVFSTFAPVFWSVLFLIFCALLFYRFMLREPLRLLGETASHIAENDLDFHIVYDGNNEMAVLCRSFEKMRESLDSSTREADVLCSSQGISVVFQNNIKKCSFAIDSEAVLQVFENLLGNALRFAEKKVWIRCSLEDGMLQMAIRDDGRGFSEKDLKKAGLCYYSGKGTDGSYHFGLGLYIASLLCGKHGGSLQIANAKEGGADLTASFQIDSP